MLASGANAFLRKPFTGEEVFGLIETLLDVEYIYEDEQPPPYSRTEGPLFLPDDLPVSLISGLQEASISLDVDRLYELLPQVAQHHPGSAERLRVLIERYDFKNLQDLLKGVKVEAAPQV